MPKPKCSIVGIVLATFLSLCSFAGLAQANQVKDNAEVRQAVLSGQVNRIQGLLSLSAKRHDVMLARALLGYAGLVDSFKPVSINHAEKPGCHYYPVTDRHEIVIVGIVVAWQQTTVYGLCWNGKKIIWWGGEFASRWAAAPYCWNNTSDGEAWDPAPKWRRAWVNGTLGGNAVIGCISLQRDEAYFFYANGGGVFKR